MPKNQDVFCLTESVEIDPEINAECPKRDCEIKCNHYESHEENGFWLWCVIHQANSITRTEIIRGSNDRNKMSKKRL